MADSGRISIYPWGMSETLTGLSPDELLILAGALRVMMMADGEVTPQEMKYSNEVSLRLGITTADWEEVWHRAGRELQSIIAVKQAAADLRRERAREIVYEVLYELANSDTIVDLEWDFLEWLDETWQARSWRMRKNQGA